MHVTLPVVLSVLCGLFNTSTVVENSGLISTLLAPAACHSIMISRETLNYVAFLTKHVLFFQNNALSTPCVPPCPCSVSKSVFQAWLPSGNEVSNETISPRKWQEPPSFPSIFRNSTIQVAVPEFRSASFPWFPKFAPLWHRVESWVNTENSIDVLEWVKIRNRVNKQ